MNLLVAYTVMTQSKCFEHFSELLVFWMSFVLEHFFGAVIVERWVKANVVRQVVWIVLFFRCASTSLLIVFFFFRVVFNQG